MFEENAEAIYKAMLKALLKGDPRVFVVLADRGFMPIPATRLGADALSTHSPYLDLRLTRDESGAFWVGICWRGAGGRVVQGECDTPSRSIFESSEFGVGAEVFTLVQRALQSYPRSPGL